ncbi:16S rRNA (uracil(1498)-N(3))-methyltransferase [Magnetospira sp. QH-2]|uniref:16S rRNA (uracil(1498)-N(3))-methyltransferase n=1 Tax=Magnetospira sp. (strain QH-2) TaxID=1288970 RepID=UPI0003E815EA|nr:16S rRNA (uracil(1498)-N(3))-methyltransferase [Magnetospira sp. QH-2]CCQ74723.1 putative ribosomal RNA small subunit methyltransferase E [Magnetospira sp. QH-2]
MSRTPTRLHVTEPLSEAAEIILPQAQAHYLRNVLRLAVGDALFLFNGRDGEWRADLRDLGKRQATLALTVQTRPQAPEPGPWLLFAPLKKDRTDFLVEKATELGAAVLWPLFTRHTMTRRVNLERLRAQATEAAEQCGRLTLPEIREPMDLMDLESRWDGSRPLWIADEARTGSSLVQQDLSVPPGLLIGPEGGFAEAELDLMGRLPFAVRVSLGPRLLRAETAAVAALAGWQALTDT